MRHEGLLFEGRDGPHELELAVEVSPRHTCDQAADRIIVLRRGAGRVP